MFNSGILDIAIGLIFIYLLLSLVCSAINEIIEARLKMRASELERGIRQLLTEKNADGKVKESLVEKFYNHPLISGLFEGRYDPKKVDANTERYASGSNLPSYIPSKNFALALMDLVLPANSAPATSTTGDSTPSGAAGATASPTDTAGTAAAPIPVAPIES
ncbi:MAG: hypothetical protein ACR2KU_13655 [Gammaproteobacteria bacterium]